MSLLFSKKAFASLLLSGALAVACAGCGTSAPAADSSAPAASPSAGAEGKSYTLGYNNFGQGAYPLDLNEYEATYAVEAMGCQNQVVNNQFTISNLITDAQNQISFGVDGLLFCGFSDAIFPSIDELCRDTQTPFVLTGLFPTQEEVQDEVAENPYFAGGVVLAEYSTGVSIAEAALEDGHQTAIIVAAAVGDVAHDPRVEGFTETFEAGGGQVLGVAHCADPSEATQKANDLLSAYPDVDCAYGTGGDYSLGLLNVLEAQGRTGELPVYGTDVDPNVIQAIRDGSIVAANGGNGPYCAPLSAALLINYLDGHPILDAEGKPYVNDELKAIVVDKDNVDDYETYWLNGHAFLPEEYQNLLYRNNPDVTYQDFEELIAGYSFESRMAVLENQ